MSDPALITHLSDPRERVAEEQMRDALTDGQLRLHYHRIVSLRTAQTRGVEALLRWEHPQGGLLYPDDFLPAVAHTPVIHEITRWVLRTSLDAMRAWPDWTMSLNISALDATRAELVGDVAEALAASGTEPARLTLELTEQAVVQNLSTAVRVLGALRSLGVGLALDDFGTGYSSLLYLRDLPITEVKIDRTFLARVPESEEDVAIVKSVAHLGRSIGLTVVAEGVETAAQAHCARSARCHSGQGYLWGQPAAAEAIDPRAVLEVPDPAPGHDVKDAASLAQVPTRIQALLDQGASLHTVAAALNRQGLRTERGTRWSAPTVAIVIARSAEQVEPPP